MTITMVDILNQIKAAENIIICGPTGAGKTKLAVTLASSFEAEIINADSRQVYKYLDIGTNKEEIVDGHISGIPIHLISFLQPDETYDAVRFINSAEELVVDLSGQNKKAIVVGGTGLYLQGLIRGIDGIEEDIDPARRDELNEMDLTELTAKIPEDKLDKLNDSDRLNKRRLVRLIEKLASAQLPVKQVGGQFGYLILYIEPEISEIEDKLKKRVQEMWDLGLVQEVENVLKLGFEPNAVALQGIGYRQVLQYLAGDFDADKCIEKIYQAHRSYAKRQLRWFRKFLAPDYLNDTSSSVQKLSLDQLDSLLKLCK